MKGQEIKDAYIKVKERLANCENFGIKTKCEYVENECPEECLTCPNYRYLSSRTLEEISHMSVMSSLIPDAR